MSEQVQSIVEAVRALDPEERIELMAALAMINASQQDAPIAHKQLVASIKGKYRHVPTSSEAFMNRRKEDTALESRP